MKLVVEKDKNIHCRKNVLHPELLVRYFTLIRILNTLLNFCYNQNMNNRVLMQDKFALNYLQYVKLWSPLKR